MSNENIISNESMYVYPRTSKERLAQNVKKRDRFSMDVNHYFNDFRTGQFASYGNELMRDIIKTLCVDYDSAGFVPLAWLIVTKSIAVFDERELQFRFVELNYEHIRRLYAENYYRYIPKPSRSYGDMAGNVRATDGRVLDPVLFKGFYVGVTRIGMRDQGIFLDLDNWEVPTGDIISLFDYLSSEKKEALINELRYFRSKYETVPDVKSRFVIGAKEYYDSWLQPKKESDNG